MQVVLTAFGGKWKMKSEVAEALDVPQIEILFGATFGSPAKILVFRWNGNMEEGTAAKIFELVDIK